MEGIKAVLWGLLLILLICGSMQKEYITLETDICRLFKDDVKLRKPGNCSQAIECKGFKSLPYKDCGTSVWDKNSERCVKSTSDKYCTPSCSKNGQKYVADQKNCQDWIECSSAGKVIKQGKCPEDLYFDQAKQLCIYQENSDCVASYEFCDVVPDGVPFKDEKNCDKYLLCNKTIKEVTCEEGTYFQAKEGMCVPKAQVECKKHPLPPDVCGNHKLAKRNRFVSDGATCSGYLFCRDMPSSKPDPDPRWDRCPDGLFFDAIQGACAASRDVKCDEDRCDGRGNRTALSSTRGCQHFLICRNNITVEEKYCGDHLFYDVTTDKCSYRETNYAACS